MPTNHRPVALRCGVPRGFVVGPFLHGELMSCSAFGSGFVQQRPNKDEFGVLCLGDRVSVKEALCFIFWRNDGEKIADLVVIVVL